MTQIPQEQSAEINGDGREENKPGLYLHKESGKELFAQNPQQGDAFVRLGYVWQRGLEESDFYVPQAPASPVDAARAEIEKMLADAKEAAAKIVADAQKEAKAPKAKKTKKEAPAKKTAEAPENQ